MIWRRQFGPQVCILRRLVQLLISAGAARRPAAPSAPLRSWRRPNRPGLLAPAQLVPPKPAQTPHPLRPCAAGAARAALGFSPLHPCAGGGSLLPIPVQGIKKSRSNFCFRISPHHSALRSPRPRCPLLRASLSRCEAARTLGRFRCDLGQIQICSANLGFLPSLRSKRPRCPLLRAS